MTSSKIRITVWNGDQPIELHATPGTNLRRLLVDSGLSPYTTVTNTLNCGGRGLCATCGVWIDEDPPAEQWHDKLAKQYGYPRLTCQITITESLTIRRVDKLIWGARARHFTRRSSD